MAPVSWLGAGGHKRGRRGGERVSPHGLSQMNARPLLHVLSLQVPSVWSEPQSSPSLHCRRKDWQLQPALLGTPARQFWYAPLVAVQLVATLLAKAHKGRKLSPVSPLPPG